MFFFQNARFYLCICFKLIVYKNKTKATYYFLFYLNSRFWINHLYIYYTNSSSEFKSFLFELKKITTYEKLKGIWKKKVVEVGISHFLNFINILKRSVKINKPKKRKKKKRLLTLKHLIICFWLYNLICSYNNILV